MALVVSGSACRTRRSTQPARHRASTSAVSTIDVHFVGDTTSATRDDLMNWIQPRRGRRLHLLRQVPCSASRSRCSGSRRRGRSRWSHLSHARRLHQHLAWRADTTVAQLNDDWMLTHEMIHLAFPSMAEKHHWIEEGISVYVEPIARVQAGQLSAERMWHDVVRDMPQGEPEIGRQRTRPHPHLGPHLLGRRDVLPGRRCPHPRANAQPERTAGRAAWHSCGGRKHHPGLGDRACICGRRQGDGNDRAS